MGAIRTESVERAMSILQAFSTQRPRMSLADLARETGLHKSTILRLTNSLQIYGFINRDEGGVYSIGASIWRLGVIFRQDFNDGEDIRPMLRELVKLTGETASFYVRAGNERVCLYRENSPNLMRFHLEEGMRMDLSTGASGMVLRRYSGEAVEDLALFSDRGTVQSVGKRNPDIASISTPVFNCIGVLRGALTVSGLIDRFDESARQAAIAPLEHFAARLQQILPG
ncbi:IclR family transcriptional regulator [uncultured Cohaesibacter sp.]|uniref:IclR family transcriptional regulator n=1 Tax=uncultured Cohaesibacter sp. TaxID=1002546 RepID=UPI00292CBDBD|nr:IclR family transcriptional regulator [uncultured Cohaesibacter sp.]